MNILLVERYICRKLQKTDELYAFLAEKLGKQTYFSMVLDTKISELSPMFLSWHRAVIDRKFGLNPDRKLLFPHPTVRQWIFDLAGEYQPEDIMDFFSQASGASKQMLSENNIESTVLDRPFLIDLVDRLEAATGKELSDAQTAFPLRYLGNVSYLDLADYFSPKGSLKIDAIRRRNGLI